jgi:hypothetical protein
VLRVVTGEKIYFILAWGGVPTLFYYPGFDKINSPGNSIFRSYFFSETSSTSCHSIAIRCYLDSLCQIFDIEPLPRYRFWTDTDFRYPVTPKWLIGVKWNGYGGCPTSQPRSGRAPAAMMDERRGSGKKPIMRNRIKLEDVSWKIDVLQSGPPALEHGTMVRLRECLQNDSCCHLGLPGFHAAKTYIDRRGARVHEFCKIGGRSPIRRFLEKPETGNREMVSPISWTWHHASAETVHDGYFHS